MPLAYYDGWYTPELVEANPEVVFVFGDNSIRRGMGGQAIIRGYPNIHGISTKRIGDMARGSFFQEGNEDDQRIVEADLDGLEALLREGKKVLIPVSRQTETISLGLERAQLLQRAPSLYKLICDRIEAMFIEYGSWNLGLNRA